MARKYSVTINLEDWEDANFDFLFTYGQAMAEWASVERGLYHWFSGITRMKDGMARAIFYGAKGFGARMEMLESVIPFAEQQTKDEIEFIKIAMKKAWQFAPFRNSIAHGEPIPIISETAGSRKIHVQMGKAKDISDKEAITVEQMANAAQNFSRLAAATIRAIPRFREGITLEQCLAQVQGLPNQAHLKADQNPSAPLQQYPGADVRVNKKAHRAAEAAKKMPEGD